MFDSLKLLSTILFEPRKAFADIETGPNRRLFVPLLLTLLGTSVLLICYYQFVDMPWLQSQMSSSIDSQRMEVARKILTRTSMTTFSVVGVFIIVPAIDLTLALYLLLYSRIAGVRRDFGKWFALVAWSSVPNLLLIPIGLLTILLAADGRIGADQLNPLSLDQLIFHVSRVSHWKGILDSVGITSIWCLVLMVIGFRAWTGSTLATSIVIPVAPYAVIFGLWSIYAGLSAAA